jgi:hypothetical protein
MGFKELQQLVLAGTLCLMSSAWAQNTSVAPEGAIAYILSPANGAIVESPVAIKFGLSKMGVAPAGVDRNGTGHHHLLVDLEMLPAMGQSLPATEQIRHFGKGQTETIIELAPGTHTLQLLMGNFLHVPHHKPVLSEQIRITVR